MPTKKQPGFTIVELLIVIVVIAILATISIVAYNGIQQRAQNTRTITAAKDYQRIIQLYITQNGGYKSIRASSSHYCLGTGNPTNWDGNPDEDCLNSGNIKHPNSTINTELATVGTLPITPTSFTVAGTGYAGIGLRQVDALDPTGANITSYPVLWYYLQGTNQDCVLRPIVKTVSGGIVIDNTITFSSTSSGFTTCMIALPDPSSA